jgi:hypothetical protein
MIYVMITLEGLRNFLRIKKIWIAAVNYIKELQIILIIHLFTNSCRPQRRSHGWELVVRTPTPNIWSGPVL